MYSKFKNKLWLVIILLISVTRVNAQLGFCSGNSGDPIFTEDFGTAPSATTEHIMLPLPGLTTYTFLGNTVFGDGKYTVTNLNYQQWNWFVVDDHTVGDANGRMLIVNASFIPGEFFRIPITGLCENTTYEFSSWLINLTPRDLMNNGRFPNPCNVRFEIWDSSDTTLLKSGNTGDFLGSLSTEAGAWRDFGLVFQTLVGQTSVILKMVNNGTGGYGNDLAIDDIVFKSCGDAITVSNGMSNNNTTICNSQTPYSTTLTANPDGSVFSTYFYQWQESTDGIVWGDIVGETSNTVTVSGITSTRYFRAKVAEAASNVNNTSCNTVSDVFLVTVNQAPPTPILNCWQTATLNNSTCMWEVAGTQPPEPTTECWETTTFNTTTCSWDVTGTQPIAPTGLQCWQTTMFNNVTCAWDITGSQPVQPTTACWETATFNTMTCLWNVTGTEPTTPSGLQCWQITVFNNITCAWDIVGAQPAQPTVNCWETVMFNNTTCIWDVTGVQPLQPRIACWEIATFDTTTCSWGITGTQPTTPIGLQCWETTVFNTVTCVWDIVGTQPVDGLDVSFCEDGDVILEPITTAVNPTYLWSTGEISETITVNVAGVYDVEVTDDTGCLFVKRTYTVTQIDKPIIDTIKSDGRDIVITTVNTGDFQYSINGSIFQPSNVFENVEGGQYTISVKGRNCRDIARKPFIHFYIPKFITPNNDGFHDTFDLKGIEFFIFSQVSIFDRYGKLLKNAVNSQLSWDGTFNNQLLPTGDYWYVIVINNQKITGHFTLKH